MLTRRRIVWCVTLALAVSLVSVWWYGPSQSSLERQLLRPVQTECRRQAEGMPPEQRGKLFDQEFTDATKRAGTNAIPVLLKWLDESDNAPSVLRQTCGWLAKKLNVRSAALSFWTSDEERKIRAILAWEAFRVLGPQARSAAAPLREICQRDTSNGGEYGRRSLIAIGEEPCATAHPPPSF